MEPEITDREGYFWRRECAAHRLSSSPPSTSLHPLLCVISFYCYQFIAWKGDIIPLDNMGDIIWQAISLDPLENPTPRPISSGNFCSCFGMHLYHVWQGFC